MPRSYGIELAELMGFKSEVIEYAKKFRSIFEDFKDS